MSDKARSVTGVCRVAQSLAVKLCTCLVIWSVLDSAGPHQLIEQSVRVCDTPNVFLPNDTSVESASTRNSDQIFTRDVFLRRSVLALTASAERLPRFTTEEGLFTGLPPPSTPAPVPLGPFDISVTEIFGTFVYLNVSWAETFNVTQVVLKFVNEGQIKQTVDIPVDLSANLTKNIFSFTSRRLGFNYKLGGLTKRRRFFLQSWGYADGLDLPMYDTESFITGETDTDDRLYNLNGIFMVLGISTILMVMVMVCVGYEKLLHQKKKECLDLMCCRRKGKPPKNKIHSGSISPEPLTGRRDAQRSSSSLQQEYTRSGQVRPFGF